MNSTDLKILADTLEEMRLRWPNEPSGGTWPNVRSFLNFRLKQVKGFDIAKFFNYLTRLEA